MGGANREKTKLESHHLTWHSTFQKFEVVSKISNLKYALLHGIKWIYALSTFCDLNRGQQDSRSQNHIIIVMLKKLDETNDQSE